MKKPRITRRDKVQTKFYMPIELHRRLVRVADGKPLSGELIRRLERSFEVRALDQIATDLRAAVDDLKEAQSGGIFNLSNKIMFDEADT